MTAYYNEIDPYAVHILKHLIADGVIAPGVVDDRSIKDVSPDEIKHYTQHHFFAGGGLWSVAARMAGWPDDRPIVTGSCPCQSFSLAGSRKGFDDSRHLWPHFHRIITGLQPHVVFGEQVSGSLGRDWFERVRSDLEPSYFSESFDIPACAVNAPHLRNRLYWYARIVENTLSRSRGNTGWTRFYGETARRETCLSDTFDCASAVDTWSVAGQIECPDGNTRRVKPGIPLLVNGVPRQLAFQRIVGNAIVPVLAAQLIGAFLDDEQGKPLKYPRKPRAELEFE